jgi:hypothetical protein
MPNNSIFSTSKQLAMIAHILQNYVRLPFSSINIPGAVMEGVLGHIRQAAVLRTYDFVDVVDRDAGLGWQVKSTLAGTPVTWKRAKIPERLELIAASEKSNKGLQALGDAIIAFCNQHAEESMTTYGLSEIGYARLVIHKNGEAKYFERLLCTRQSPQVFNPAEFSWRWSTQKKVVKKEQLTALHGVHKPTGKKWFAWHGRGENQLHFSGEGAWWPPAGDRHTITFRLPSEAERLRIEAFIDLLAASDNPLPSE